MSFFGVTYIPWLGNIGPIGLAGGGNPFEDGFDSGLSKWIQQVGKWQTGAGAVSASELGDETGGSSGAVLRLVALVPGESQFVQARLWRDATDDTTIGLTVKHQAGNQFYLGCIRTEDGGTDTWEIWRRSSGGFEKLVEFAEEFVDGTLVRLTYDAVAANVTFQAWDEGNEEWVTKCATNHSLYQESGGTGGVRVDNLAGKVDDFLAGIFTLPAVADPLQDDFSGGLEKWVVEEGRFTVTDGVMKAVEFDPTHGAIARTASPIATANQYAQAKITRTTANELTTNLIVKFLDSNNFYMGQIQRLSGTDSWRLYKRSDGTYTELTTAVELEHSDGDLVRLSYDADTGTLKMDLWDDGDEDWDTVISATDTDLQAFEGSVGVRASGVGATWDDFKAGVWEGDEEPPEGNLTWATAEVEWKNAEETWEEI